MFIVFYFSDIFQNNFERVRLPFGPFAF